MTIYEILQEEQKKFKFSKKGILYLNSFAKEEEDKPKRKDKPFSLYKVEEGKRINKKAKDEMNKARAHGNPTNATYEMKEGILHFVPSKTAPKVEEEEVKEEEITAEDETVA